MAKYLLLWESDLSRASVSRKERKAGLEALMAMTKQDLKTGIMKDHGVFVGEANGYAVAEGTEVEIGKMVQQYIPFISFKVHPIASLSQVEEVIKSMPG